MVHEDNNQEINLADEEEQAMNIVEQWEEELTSQELSDYRIDINLLKGCIRRQNWDTLYQQSGTIMEEAEGAPNPNVGETLKTSAHNLKNIALRLRNRDASVGEEEEASVSAQRLTTDTKEEPIKINLLLVDDEIKKPYNEMVKVRTTLKKYFAENDEFRLGAIYEEEYGRKAIERIKEDGDIQVAILDHELHEEDEYNGTTLMEEIKKIRPEIDVFLLTVYNPMKFIKNQQQVRFDSVFQKGEEEYDTLYLQIIRCLKKRCQTPFFDDLMEYANRPVDTFHALPLSHSKSLKKSTWIRRFLDFYGDKPFRAESSATAPPLDSLLSPKRGLEKAQKLAAKAFGSYKTRFVTNGTSTANKIVLQAIVEPGDTILVDRNCHKSHHYGILITGAKPIYLEPRQVPGYNLYGTVPKESIEAALKNYPEAKVLLLTNSTFDGLLYDIAKIVEITEKNNTEKNSETEMFPNTKVFVDEAWFGYANFHPRFRERCAIKAEAHYSTQSTHKTLSAFRQGSMIHINDPEFEDKFHYMFEESYYTHTTTSPNYGILASLDVARMQAVMEGYKLVDNAIKLAEELRTAIAKSDKLKKYFKVLEERDMVEAGNPDNVMLDPTKITLGISNTGIFGKEFAQEYLLEKHDIQINRYTHNTVLFIVHIGVTRGAICRLYDALVDIAEELDKQERFGQKIQKIEFDKIPESAGMHPCYDIPRKAFYAKSQEREIVSDDGKGINKGLEGAAAARLIVPYPPGIPILVPGEIITPEILECIRDMAEHGVEIHGYNDKKKTIRVVNDTLGQ